MKRASGEPARRAAERLCATPSDVYSGDEPPTSPINNGVLMTMPQAREALLSIPPDLQPLVWAIARGFWDDGFGTGRANLPRIPPADRSPEGTNTLAPLGKRRGKR